MVLFLLLFIRELQKANKMPCLCEPVVFNENKPPGVHNLLAEETVNFFLTNSIFWAIWIELYWLPTTFTHLEKYLTFTIFQKKKQKANSAQASNCQTLDNMEKKQTRSVWGQGDPSKLKVLKISQWQQMSNCTTFLYPQWHLIHGKKKQQAGTFQTTLKVSFFGHSYILAILNYQVMATFLFPYHVLSMNKYCSKRYKSYSSLSQSPDKMN